MEAAALIGAVVLLAAAGLGWTARRVHVSDLDALELAAKVSVSDPVSALDWPELRVRAIVPQPGDQPLVLLLVGWPEHPQQAATLLLRSTAAITGRCRCSRAGAPRRHTSRRPGGTERAWSYAAGRAWSGSTRY
jgi:hypothetical protein